MGAHIELIWNDEIRNFEGSYEDNEDTVWTTDTAMAPEPKKPTCQTEQPKNIADVFKNPELMVVKRNMLIMRGELEGKTVATKLFACKDEHHHQEILKQEAKMTQFFAAYEGKFPIFSNVPS